MTYDPEKAAEVERLRTRIEELAESRAEMVEQRNALFEERQLALDRVAELEERKDTFLKALQEVTAKATEFKGLLGRMRFSLHVTTSKKPDEPIALFEYGDMADRFGNSNYPGRYEVREIAALAKPEGGDTERREGS